MGHQDHVLDYWEETLGQALCEVDAYQALTSDQQKVVAKILADAADVRHEYFGTYNIPNPDLIEIERLKREHQKEIKEWEQRDHDWAKNIARQQGVETNRVSLRDGEVKIWLR